MGMTLWTLPASVGRTVVLLGHDDELDYSLAAAWESGGFDVIVFTCLEQASTTDESRKYHDLGQALQNAWLAVDVTPESLFSTPAGFKDFETLAPSDAIFCSNLEGTVIASMAASLQPTTIRRVLHMHFCKALNRNVELALGVETDPSILNFLKEKLQDIGLFPWIHGIDTNARVCDRLNKALGSEVSALVEEGVSPPGNTDTIRASAKIMHKSSLGANGQPRAPKLLVVDVGLSATPFMAVPTAGRILVTSSEEKSPARSLIPKQQLPDGVAVHRDTDKVFWSSMGWPGTKSGALFCCDMNGENVKEIVPRDSLWTPKQLTVEPGSGKLYFTDREGLRVMRCNLDGSGLETLIRTGDSEIEDQRLDTCLWCVGVAASPSTGKIYWTQKGPSKGAKGRLFRANIDMAAGETPETRSDIECLLRNLPEPINLALDEEERMIYWTDRGELPFGNSINRASLELLSPIPSDSSTTSWPGKDYELLVRDLHEAIGIALDLENKHIYATELGGNVYRFDMDGKNRKRFCEEQGAYAGIAIA